MKIQNCPLCGSEPLLGKYSSNPEGTKYASCSNEDCEMWIVPMILPDLWNRIRIAPDDKPVKYYPGRKNWMNPNYQKDKREIITGDIDNNIAWIEEQAKNKTWVFEEGFTEKRIAEDKGKEADNECDN